MRGVATLLNPDQSGLEIYTLNPEEPRAPLLGAVPVSGCGRVLWGLASLTPRTPEEDGAPSWVNHYHLTSCQMTGGQGTETASRKPSLALPARATRCAHQSAAAWEHTNPPSSLPAQVQSPWGAGSGTAGLQAWCWAREAGPESGSKEHLSGRGKSPVRCLAH